MVFRPFQRAEMRALLEQGARRGAGPSGSAPRPWAVELDQPAIEFLIEQGFSPELGARPLKRALERHLLAPIAQFIVEQAAPEGDQFLFVSAPEGKRLQVAFVDPDGPADTAGERDVDAETDAALDVRALALGRRCDARTTRFLLDELRRTESAVVQHVRPRKDALLNTIQQPGFWEDDARHGVLAEAEYLDRLETAMKTAGKLGDRLTRHATRNGGAGANELVGLLSIRLHVLQAAIEGIDVGSPADVFLRLRPAASSEPEAAAGWAMHLADMYVSWATRRGMRLERLDALEHLYAVSGLGAATILAPEAGLHVLEARTTGSRGDRASERTAVLVELAGWPTEDPRSAPAVVELARAELDRQTADPVRVVRRYRRDPSPLVRDAVRRYRTGRLDLVLAGDFDLF